MPKAKNFSRNQERRRGAGIACVRCALVVKSPTVGVYANDAGCELLTIEEARKSGWEALWPVGPECQKVPEIRPFLVDFYAPPLARTRKEMQ